MNVTSLTGEGRADAGGWNAWAEVFARTGEEDSLEKSVGDLGMRFFEQVKDGKDCEALINWARTCDREKLKKISVRLIVASKHLDEICDGDGKFTGSGADGNRNTLALSFEKMDRLLKAALDVHLQARDLQEGQELLLHGDRVIVRNNRAQNLYVRVYEKADTTGKGWGSWTKSWLVNTYEPRSKIIEVKPYDSQQFEINEGKTDRWVYYTEAKDEEEARGYLTDKGPAASLLKSNFTKAIKRSKWTRLGRVVIHEATTGALMNAVMHAGIRMDTKFAQKAEEIRKANRVKQQKIDKDKGVPRVAVSDHHSGDISVSDEEKAFSEARFQKCKEAERGLWDSVPGLPALPDDASFPRMGLCGSGGGFRAMLAFDGFMAAMQEEGLLDMTSFISGTSGSTWAIADLLANKGDPEALKSLPSRIEMHLRRGVISKATLDSVAALIPHLLAGRTKNEENASSLLHEWAARLFTTALSGVAPTEVDQEDVRLKPLHEQEVDPERSPLPIFNMVASSRFRVFREQEPIYELVKQEDGKYVKRKVGSKDVFDTHYRHDKWEMTPIDVTAHPDKEDRDKGYLAWRVETRGLGRSYDEGLGQLDNATPAPLSLIQTITTAGSAPTVGLRKVCEESIAATFAVAVLDAAARRISGRLDVDIFPGVSTRKTGEHKLSLDPKNPSEEPYTGVVEGLPVRRPVRGRGGDKAILRDAGMDYNLPMLPLMRSARGCGIAVVCDVSGDLNEKPGDALFRAVEDAKSLGRKVPKDLTSRRRFDRKVKEAIKKHEFPIVFGNPEDPEEFCVIYVPCVKTGLKSGTFSAGNWGDYDPTQIGTMKLNYEPTETRRLHEFGRRLGKHVSPMIKQVLILRIQAMNKLQG